jgi:hypothetical protein
MGRGGCLGREFRVLFSVFFKYVVEVLEFEAVSRPTIILP